MSDPSIDRARAIAGRLAIATVTLLALGLALAYVASWVPVWPCSLLEHFGVQAVAGGIVVAAAAAALKLRGSFDLAVIATLLHAMPVVADLASPASPEPPDGTPLRVLVVNVHTASTSYDRVRRLIAEEDPDVIGLVEVDRRWLDALVPALAGYGGRIEAPRPDNFGIALYARGDVTGGAIDLGSSVPTIVASVRARGTRFDAVVTHPLPPTSGAALESQRDQLDAIAARARDAAGTVVVLGDLNATPWSRPFRRIVRKSGLCDTRAGFGIQATFPSGSWLLRIPIDHVLVSCSVGVRDRRIGRDVGSDHLPVVVDLVLPR